MMFLNQFWAPRKLYNPCGMFTEGHMILLFLSIALLCILLYTSKNLSTHKIKRLTKILAIGISILELIKIGFNFHRGYTWINAWFPISYCSIFIYSLWLSGYGKDKWREMGDIFLGGVSIIAGAAFLLFPSTSITLYPVWHYLCLYSMLFHTLMVYMGIMYLSKMEIKFNKNTFKRYLKYYLFFALIAIVLNNNYGSNLMLLREPASIPVPALKTLYEAAPWGYTLLVFIVYLFVPYGITAYISKFKKSEEANDEFNTITIGK